MRPELSATRADVAALTTALCRHMTQTLVVVTVINATQLIAILALFRWAGGR